MDLKEKTFEMGDVLVESFDFEAVHALMILNKWTWYDTHPKSPSIEQLKSQVYSIIATMAGTKRVNNRVGCGGFQLFRFQWDNSIELELTFTWKMQSTTIPILVMEGNKGDEICNVLEGCLKPGTPT